MSQDSVKATYQVHTLESGSSSLPPATKDKHKHALSFLLSFFSGRRELALFFLGILGKFAILIKLFYNIYRKKNG